MHLAYANEKAIIKVLDTATGSLGLMSKRADEGLMRATVSHAASLKKLHIGHSYLTHSFILRKEEAPVCVACKAVITVKLT